MRNVETDFNEIVRTDTRSEQELLRQYRIGSIFSIMVAKRNWCWLVLFSPKNDHFPVLLMRVTFNIPFEKFENDSKIPTEFQSIFTLFSKNNSHWKFDHPETSVVYMKKFIWRSVDKMEHLYWNIRKHPQLSTFHHI